MNIVTKPNLTKASQPVTVLRRVGPNIAKCLQRLGICSLQDLLFHLPVRYQDRTRVVSIAGAHVGDEVTIQGKVLHTEIKFARRRMLLVCISDGTGLMNLRFFNFSGKQRQGLEPGVLLSCFGEVRYHKNGLELIHPEYRRIDPDAEEQVTNCLTPIYPATEGLRQLTLRSLTDQVVIDSDHLAVDLSELLPEEVRRQLAYPALNGALAYVHRPPPDADIEQLQNRRHPAQQRLVFEELLAHHLSLRRLRQRHQHHGAPALIPKKDLLGRLQKRLPFKLTAAQQRVVKAIIADLSQARPMQRLVQGDVGSGKTVVAAMAVAHTIDAGYQAAVMAPTEILAGQHYDNFKRWFEPLSVEIAWLTGKIKGKARQRVLDEIESGAAQLVVGTQALFQELVQFNDLGLVIIDEQHRFGVHQRLALRNKGSQASDAHGGEYYPHQLVMTATPIPRTLTMVAYADLDCSVIDELPAGRLPVETVVVANNRRDEVIDRVHAACRQGRQSYWVCTLIEESEQLQCQAAEESAQTLRQLLPDINIGLIHGRMKAADKEDVMAQFKSGGIDLLVATTVIEVGVDVPNASLMIIDNAERLGLSQLHQLRGRVGRGAIQSACVLLYQAPLSLLAKQRLSILRETNDGFEVARRDLELRGPGEVLGTKQAGLAQFQIADLGRDQAVLNRVPAVADQLLKQCPERVDLLIQRWLGQKAEYGDV